MNAALETTAMKLPEASMPVVLLIEDEPGDTALIRWNLLEKSDSAFAVHSASSLAAAQHLIDVDGVMPDVVLLDLNLPDSSGTQTVARCRELTDAPIVVLTGLDDLAATRAAIESGAEDFLSKGGDAAMLRRALHYAMLRHRRDADARLAATFFSHSREGIIVTDAQGGMIEVNPAFTHITGYAREQVLGRNPRFLHSGRQSGEFYQSLWQDLLANGHWEGEMWNRRMNGELFVVQLTISVVRDALARVRRFVGLFADITARKENEALLLQARSAADAANVAKSSFLANMSHEIRTPMNAILGMLNLVQATELSERQYDYIHKSEVAAKSLLGLINDILDFSKIDAGKLELDPHLFRIDRMLRDLTVVLSANAGNKPIDILFDIDLDLPEVVLGDSMRLSQILINLGGNAVKFTAQGQIVIAIHRVNDPDATPDSVYLEFSVTDSGIGIAPEQQGRIFTGFAQAEGSTTRKYGGTGLGLVISQRLVQAMGGSLELRSAPGQGTRFFFTLRLPVAKTIPTEIQEVARQLPQRFKALIVDDNPVARELMLRMTSQWTSTCEVASSGEQALSLMRQASGLGSAPFEVIYLDCLMPGGIDGWETAKHLRAISAEHMGPKPVIIMVTSAGRDMLGTRTAEEQDLLDGFLVKPITASMLLDSIVDAKSSSPRLRQMVRNVSCKRSLTGMRILVVEDNLVNQQVAEELLSAQGALVSLAVNGQLGVDAVAAAVPQFDAVLMDVQMPVMDGYAATWVIRNTLNFVDLPIIGLTANAMVSDRTACLQAGMNEHIGKPFDLPQLVSALIRLTGWKTIASEVATRAAGDAQAGTVNFKSDAIDLGPALARMAGMKSLYLRAAKEYQKSIATLASRLAALVEAGDFKQAGMLAHSNKGTAATLGLEQLSAELKDIELACKAETAVLGAARVAALSALVDAACRGLDGAMAVLGSSQKTEKIVRQGSVDGYKP